MQEKEEEEEVLMLTEEDKNIWEMHYLAAVREYHNNMSWQLRLFIAKMSSNK